MTGKVLDGNPKGLLIVILPFAFAAVLVYKAWRIILLLAALLVAFISWDTYQWQQKCQQIDPLFNQLIKVNQGRITQTDLAVEGIAKGRAAYRYLEGKASEYGAYKRTVQGATVYYFITATTLGTIFDDSEPELETPQLNQSTAAPVQFVQAPINQEVAEIPVAEIPIIETPSIETPAPVAESTKTEEVKAIANSFAGLVEIKEERKHLNETETDNPTEASPAMAALILIQSDLAKRLDTTSSTIARRKAEADFTQWSQSKDPDGLAWRYDEDSKLFTTV